MNLQRRHKVLYMVQKGIARVLKAKPEKKVTTKGAKNYKSSPNI